MSQGNSPSLFKFRTLFTPAAFGKSLMNSDSNIASSAEFLYASQTTSHFSITLRKLDEKSA